MLPSGKVRSFIAIATACTCISVAVYSILKRPAYTYAGLVSVHIHSYLYLKQKLDISQLKRMNYVGPCRFFGWEHKFLVGTSMHD